MFSLLALLLLAPATHQDGVALSPEPAGGQLAQARAAFAAADRDGDGALDAAEIRAAGIPLAAAGAHDADADGRLSRDEFLVYYRNLLRNAGRKVQPELERAVRDILVERSSEAVRSRSSRAAVEVAEGGRMRTAAEARERLLRARAGLAERPERALGIREGVAPVAAPEVLGLEVARGRLAQARGLLEDREQRLAAARDRIGAPSELDPTRPAPLDPTEGARAAADSREGTPPSARPPGDRPRPTSGTASDAGVAGGQPRPGAAGQGPAGLPAADPPGPRAEMPAEGESKQP